MERFNQKETFFKKVSIKDEIPKKSGKYIVYAQSTSRYYRRENMFNCRYIYDEKRGKGTWDCNNQEVTHWLKNNIN